jgi:hypothetical protein
MTQVVSFLKVGFSARDLKRFQWWVPYASLRMTAVQSLEEKAIFDELNRVSLKGTGGILRPQKSAPLLKGRQSS